ncbi:MAG: aspartyl protease family protein [Planctomycetaceae bacterium]|nr:aspartyl protease family protein [Planctomycetaceae bacterium]
MLLLPVRVGVKEYRFAIDTGAEITVFDTALEDTLKATSQSANARTTDGSSKIVLFEAPALSVGKLNIEPLIPVACMDLSKLRMVSGEPVFGIIGMDVLQGLVISIDFDLGKVEVLSHADESAGLPVRIKYEHHRIPTVLADLPGGDRVPFVIDTGLSCIGMLHESTFDRLRQAGLISNNSESMRLTLSGTTRHQIGSLAMFELAETQHASLTFDRANHNVLGLGLLSRYKITLDFPQRTVYLRKGLRFAAPDVRDLSGMHVVQVDEKIVIDHVDPGSAAAEAGLREQDLLVTVDNLVTKPDRLFDIRQLLAAPNPSFPVVFRRNGRIETTTLCLKRD